MLLDVCISNTREIIFNEKAKSVILPGEQGVFEIMPFHRPIMSRLLSGALSVDSKRVLIKRGIVKVSNNKVAIIIEERE